MYCCSRPSQARPGRRLVELQSNLGLGEELELLGWAPSCCLRQGSTNLEEHKEIQVGRVGRYLRELGMPPLTLQEEGLTKGTSCSSHCPMSGAS